MFSSYILCYTGWTKRTRVWPCPDARHTHPMQWSQQPRGWCYWSIGIGRYIRCGGWVMLTASAHSSSGRVA